MNGDGTGEGPRPVETGRQPVPGWLLGLMGVVLVVGLGYLAVDVGRSGPSDQPSGSGGPTAQALLGRAGCQGCHGTDLSGQGIFPSLHGIASGPKSENLQQLATDHPDDWPNLWIDGTGPEVAGLQRNAMPVFGNGVLTPDEIATIVDYLKTLE